MLAAMGCVEPVDGSVAPAVGDPAVLIEEVAAPAARRLRLCWDRESDVVVTWDDGVDVRSARSDGAVDHVIDLVGMRPAATVSADIVATARDGTTASISASWSVASLPDDWPDVDVVAFDPSRAAAGFTVLSPRRSLGTGWVWVLDAAGDPVWWLTMPVAVNDFAVLSDGLLTVGDTVVAQFDWLGNEVGRWGPAGTVDPSAVATDVEADAFHHEVGVWGDRTLVLASRLEAVADFPVSYDDPLVTADVTIAGDILVAFDAAGSGETLWEASAHLDLGRIGYGSLSKQPNGAVDWAHVNAAERLPTDDGWLMSSRHQNAVFAVDDATGAVRWLVAPPEDWSPALEGVRLVADAATIPTFQQHAPELDASGTRLLVFDNHGEGVSPWTGLSPVPPAQSTSRVVEFELDVAGRAISTSWVLDRVTEGTLYVPAMGDVDRLANGHVLALFGGATYTQGQANQELGFDDRRVHLVEYDPIGGDIVMERVVSTPLGTWPGGWVANRVEHFESAPWL